MVDLSNVRIETEETHLFIPMSAVLEIRWLLDQAGIDSKSCYMRPWRKVLNHQVPAIAHVSDEQRDAEIDAYYGENAKYVKSAPAVLISHYNPKDLYEAFKVTLEGGRDKDYDAYDKKIQEEANADDMPTGGGISIIRRDRY